MAQKEKFKADQLMDAFLKYSEVCHGKIKISDLARWASKSIPGMEGVQAHNFRAKRKVYNRRTGKPEERNLEVYDRIQQINRIRTGAASSGQNTFLHASDPDSFLRLPKTEQRRQILEARAFIETTISKDKNILLESEMIHAENNLIKDQIGQQEKLLAAVQKRQDVLDRQLRLVIDEIDETKRAEMLRSCGVMDGGFDLAAYQASLRQDIREASSISATIKEFTKRHSESVEEGATQENENQQSLINTITGGLDI